MKILKVISILVFSLAVFPACKSTNLTVQKNTPVEEPVEKPVEYPVRQETSVWIDTTGKAIPVNSGIIHLRYKNRLGSFNICVMNKKEKLIPVLATANEYTSSAFYLKYGEKIIKLIADKNITSGYTKNNDGLRITYSVAGCADVLVEMKCFSSMPGKENDMVKVTAKVTNKSAKRTEMGLKAVLDTVLGEIDTYHFYTKNSIPIKSETIYRTMKNEQWFISRNLNASMQIFFDGADTTAPDVVALGNLATFDKNEWIPNMYSYRDFDSVFAYNNSAVEVVWPCARLNPNESLTYVFYMAFATDGENPTGEKYLFPEPEKTEAPAAVQAEAPAPAETVLTRKIESYRSEAQEKTPVQNPRKPSVSANNKTAAPAPKKAPALSESLSDQQLTLGYVENLLDRIIALEENDANLNHAEILQLNAELDAILETLGL